MRIKTITPSFLNLLLLSSISYLSFNQAISATEQINYHQNTLSAQVGAGYLGGESNEYVYETDGSTVSQLNWVIHSAAIVTADISMDLLPWLSWHVNGWTTLERGRAVMDDYDWLNPGQSNWTDWSHHPDTDLNYANHVDINLRPWFLQNQTYKLGAIIGYQKTRYDFLAKGGCFQYYNGLYTGCFPVNEPGIGYEQTFETGYLGLTGQYLMNHVELDATVKVSPWVNSSDIDQHYERNLTFMESGNHSIFSSLSMTAGYYFSQHVKVFFEAAFTQFTNSKADMLINNHEDNDLFYITDGAGLGNHNYLVALGVQFLNDA